MAIGKGGQSGNQSGSQSGSYTGNVQTDTTNMPVAPQGYRSTWESLLGMNGTTPGQQQAGSYYSGILGAKTPDVLANYGAYSQEKPYTLSRLESDYGYTAPSQVTSTPVSAGQVTPGTGASFMDAYKNPYENDVVNTTLADLGKQYGIAQNQNKMAATAAGAYGGSGSALRASQTTDDFLRNVAATSAGLRSGGFTTAANLGQTDATRQAAVDAANADRALQADTFSSGQNFAGQQFNANLADSREKFDVGAAYQGNANRNAALDKILAAQSGSAGALGSLGQTSFAQMLAALSAGVPLFGNTSSTTGTSSGTSQGTSDQSSNSKGGGVSFA